ncbi:putative KH and PIN-domain containing protein [uncultured archaeon]|nr:putative KH and PIN-domain containing protein [uncultured archaeon]
MESGILVPDASALVDGKVTEIVAGKRNMSVIIPNAVVAELEWQAREGREAGIEGLSEIKRLQDLAKDGGLDVRFDGELPRHPDFSDGSAGRLGELVRRVAYDNRATLVTGDRISALTAQAKGITVLFIERKDRVKKPRLFSLFDHETMSVHLKENAAVYAKKGSVGEFRLTRIGDKLTREDAEAHVREIIEYAHNSTKGFVEIEERGATVIQLGEYRIVIARPPFSSALEVTAVKPLVKLLLSDYRLSDRLLSRLSDHAEGVFVAGRPGAGKTTFVQALAEHYRTSGKIIKTMEQPRDLSVHEEITQYGPLSGSMEKTGDLLLLVRPDYTIYDELRKTSDFTVFADMRLAGVGLVGVTHASQPIDAIQRLVGRVELGVIPHVVDTVLYIEKGKITKVYELSMTVKVPAGMTESDLSRPVIEIRDFENGQPEYEMYSFGEEVVVIPLADVSSQRPSRNFRHRGRQGGRTTAGDVPFQFTKKHLIFKAPHLRDCNVRILAGEEEVARGRVNRAGNLRIRRNTTAASLIEAAAAQGKQVRMES